MVGSLPGRPHARISTTNANTDGTGSLTQASPGEQREGAGSVRDRMFGVGLHFAEGQPLSVGDEHRIIAETLRPTRRPHQMAVNFSFKQLGRAVGPGETQRTREVGARTGLSPAAAAAYLLGNPAHGEGEVLGLAGPAC